MATPTKTTTGESTTQAGLKKSSITGAVENQETESKNTTDPGKESTTQPG